MQIDRHALPQCYGLCNSLLKASDGIECDGIDYGVEWDVIRLNGMCWDGMKWDVLEWIVTECDVMRWNVLEWNGMCWY